MTQQHQKWIQLVKDKLSSEGMTQTHLARACGVKKPTISELLKYGKGSNRLKNRVCDVLGIDETWVDLGEQEVEENESHSRFYRVHAKRPHNPRMGLHDLHVLYILNACWGSYYTSCSL